MVVGAVQHVDEVVARHRPRHFLSRVDKPVLDLLVEFVPIRHDDDAGLRTHQADPLRQPDHQETLARALRMPDDAAFLLRDARLRRLQCKELARTHHLLVPPVEHDRIVDEPRQADRFEHFQQRTVEKLRIRGRRERARLARTPTRLFPLDPELLRRLDGRVLESFGLVTRHHQLRRHEERHDLAVLLVSPVLRNRLVNADRRLLELKDDDRNAVDVDDNIRPTMREIFRHAPHRHLFGNLEYVVRRVLPVDEHHLLLEFAAPLRDGHRALDALVDRKVHLKKPLVLVADCLVPQQPNRLIRLLWRRALPLGQELLQRLLSNRFVLDILQVADVLVMMHIAEKLHDPVLHRPFWINRRHHATSSLTFPVNNCCIIPVFTFFAARSIHLPSPHVRRSVTSNRAESSRKRAFEWFQSVT